MASELAASNSFLVLGEKKVDLGGKKEFSNPLGLWRDNEYQFSLLALLARRILCIPPTSAPLERTQFLPTAGHTITKLRASL